jgi:hypothetical protein
MARIGGGDDAVYLEPTVRTDRHFGAGRDIAAIAHELGEPVIGTGRSLAIARPFRGGVEHGQMLWLQHLAAELERVLPGGMGKLVDEALGVDRVLFGVNAAPRPGSDVRIAHRERPAAPLMSEPSRFFGDDELIDEALFP